MPPTETRTRAPDIWLDDALWTDARPSRRDEATPQRRSGAVALAEPPVERSPFYDHEQEHRAPAAIQESGSANALAEPDLEFDEPDFVEDDDVGTYDDGYDNQIPGILRRPLVEVQQSLPRSRDRLIGLERPDRIALLAVALAVVMLLAAIITSSG